MLSESQIINAIVRGEKKAFSLLFNSYKDIVYNTSLSYSKNPEEAEEITQDVFIKVYKNITSFKGDASLGTWIYRITINTSLNHLKKKKNIISLKERVVLDIKEVDFYHPGAILENKEKAAALYRAMDCLPDTQKTAFILSFIEYLPRQEVADIMETTLKAVESLLQRAKSKMRIELEKTYPERRKSKK